MDREVKEGKREEEIGTEPNSYASYLVYILKRYHDKFQPPPQDKNDISARYKSILMSVNDW